MGGYRSRIAKQKAIVLVAHALIVIIWHVLATGKPYHDRGAGYFTRLADQDREAQRPGRRRLTTYQEADGTNRRRLLPRARPRTIHLSVSGIAARLTYRQVEEFHDRLRRLRPHIYVLKATGLDVRCGLPSADFSARVPPCRDRSRGRCGVRMRWPASPEAEERHDD